MQEQTLDGHAGRPVAIDLCLPCQSFWFDAHESVRLTQASALVAQFQKADARERQPIDPALPLALLRARRQAEAAFRTSDGWTGRREISSTRESGPWQAGSSGTRRG